MINKKIESLQALRAFAAISVMLFHGTEVLYQKAGYIFLNHFFMAGFAGVQIFFVLSGFIIFYTSYGKEMTPKTFLIKRIVRIYPVHTLIVLILVAFYFLSPSQDQAYRGRFGPISSSLTLIPFDQMVLGPSWTLCFEMMFYVIFAFTFLKSKRLFIMALIIWTIIIVLAYFFNFQTDTAVINNIYDPINFSFIFGCLIAWFYIYNKNIKYSQWLLLPAVIIFSIYWICQVNGMIPNRSDVRLLWVGLPSALLVLAVLYSHFKIPKFLVYLGDASFSLYLLHFPLIRILLKVFLKLGIERYTNHFVVSVCIFILIILISCFFYSYVESNILKYLNGRLNMSKNKALQSNDPNSLPAPLALPVGP